MVNRKSIYLFLLSSTIVSAFKGLNIFLFIMGLSIITILIVNRGLFYTFRANKFLSKKNCEKGYPLLKKAYDTGYVPYLVVAGYIYLSLKLGYMDNADKGISKVLNRGFQFKLKPRYEKEIKSYRALYKWLNKENEEALGILEDIYNDGFKNSNFYGNYGHLLIEGRYFDKAFDIIEEALEFSPNDKISMDNKVSLYIEKGLWDEALKHYGALIELKPEFPEAYYHGAQIKLSLGQKGEARDLIEKCESYDLFCISTITSDDINSLKSKL